MGYAAHWLNVTRPLGPFVRHDGSDLEEGSCKNVCVIDVKYP